MSMLCERERIRLVEVAPGLITVQVKLPWSDAWVSWLCGNRCTLDAPAVCEDVTDILAELTGYLQEEEEAPAPEARRVRSEYRALAGFG